MEGARGRDEGQQRKVKNVKSEPGIKHFFQIFLLFTSESFDKINIAVQRKKGALVLHIGSGLKSLLSIWKFIVPICTVFTYPFIYEVRPLLLFHWESLERVLLLYGEQIKQADIEIYLFLNPNPP